MLGTKSYLNKEKLFLETCGLFFFQIVMEVLSRLRESTVVNRVTQLQISAFGEASPCSNSVSFLSLA